MARLSQPHHCRAERRHARSQGSAHLTHRILKTNKSLWFWVWACMFHSNSYNRYRNLHQVWVLCFASLLYSSCCGHQSVHYRTFMVSLASLATRASNAPQSPHCNNPKYLQTLLNIPWAGSLPVENHCPREMLVCVQEDMQGCLFIVTRNWEKPECPLGENS
jgi:hypothetical protein